MWCGIPRKLGGSFRRQCGQAISDEGSPMASIAWPALLKRVARNRCCASSPRSGSPRSESCTAMCMMSPASNRSQQTGQVKSPSTFGFAKAGSLIGSADGSGWVGGRETSACGTRNSVPQSGQSTFIPAASSSAFNFRPHDGHKKRNSIIRILISQMMNKLLNADKEKAKEFCTILSSQS